MRMKTTKALLFCSFTIVLLLGVVGIASAAPPVIGEPCPCGRFCADATGWDFDCEGFHFANAPPFCWGHPKGFKGFGLRNARVPAACLASCLRNAPKGNQ